MLLCAKEVNIKMNRIREIRENKKLSLKKTTELLKSNDLLTLTPDALAKYERGDRQPNEATWQALADFFNVSVDYLKGYGYSKDDIYKLLDTMYKEDWMDEKPLALGLADKILTEKISNNLIANFFAKSTIDIYCENHGIKLPISIRRNYGKYDLDFWKENFSFIFDDTLVKRLLTTRDSYTDNEIKRLILSAIAVKNTRYTIEETLNKLSSN